VEDDSRVDDCSSRNTDSIELRENNCEPTKSNPKHNNPKVSAFSLTFWQHAYTLNALLIIQETADTFGLLCLGLLFVGSQLFSRNSMLSVFLLLQSSTLESSSTINLSPNNTKRLTYASTTWSYLLKLCTQPLRVVQSRLRNDAQTLK
jgi:hypothetical protein